MADKDETASSAAIADIAAAIATVDIGAANDTTDIATAVAAADIAAATAATADNDTAAATAEIAAAADTAAAKAAAAEARRLEERRAMFGNRQLTDEDNVFSWNAWDNVQWNDEQVREAKEKVAQNSATKLTAEQAEKLFQEAPHHWDSFYDIHQNRFFKDRNWLFTEFPELAADIDDNGRRILELGCGAGNTVLPLLVDSLHSKLKVFGCDFSTTAIEVLRQHRDFDAKRCELFVMDVTDHDWVVPFEENSMDMVILIFVLSAIKPSKMKRVVENCYRYLKPGGLLMFRDYGRYDLAQLRLKDGKCLEDNFYVRGDGTFVYFFTNEELREMFSQAGFVELQNFTDRRLQVNRSRLLKMYRVWIQAKYQKPL